MLKITKANLPAKELFHRYWKVVPVDAMEIPGEFLVDIAGDGFKHCERGYLILDLDEEPYPVRKDKFERINGTLDDLIALVERLKKERDNGPR